ncbi:8-demethyl-8-alpha-L-rhamnosyl tetracenomycin-C 2'-O-methyltransferase [Alteripontixanthobacter maritimus]|uniref:8-demethyl-8-alpha-L-rhamnosyl tetracenomycin-C 2'-O-methyltransferase n=1 Tax=Alteripontixanthobacter maritimus TaxID=2161824 RepID=A0A369Q7U7_9SPHN|nr:class I SAM-dependent methyltransferase [Alteripontixanthobacter maritimus]RDC58999.1 8-demethyl-8-alpha-L-rhamnosyl tetracenomycin-C 2'-O-methyltransferase [Alteripontixanthobacter maritimus]
MTDSGTFASFEKSPYRSVKVSTYFDTYDHLFAKYRGKPITFVEIGIFGGGSLFMWRDYFGPEARIIGIDFNPNAKKWEKDGFEIFIGNQSDEGFWENFVKEIGPVDVVLDDGGHTYEQQIITVESLLANMKDGGTLAVEDTHTSYMNRYGRKKYSFLNYVKQYLDRINLRFGSLDKTKADDRVWSIQVFESLVAFHIDRAASRRKSELIDNSAEHDDAQDYRFADDSSADALLQRADRLKWLKAIPGVRKLGAGIVNAASGRKNASRLKRYFD